MSNLGRLRVVRVKILNPLKVCKGYRNSHKRLHWAYAEEEEA